MRFFVPCLVFVIAIAPGLARGASLTVQGESYTSSYNIVPDAIHVEGGYYLAGLDYEGEFAVFELSAPTFGTYGVTMRCWGNIGAVYHFHLVTMPVQGEEPQTIEFTYTGAGFCGS